MANETPGRLIRLYLDEDSQDGRLLRVLREGGADVLSSAEAGMNEAPDAAQLAFATSERRVIVTANVRDFSILHALAMAEGRHHGGIVIRRQRGEHWARQAQGLLLMRSLLRPGDLADSVEFLSAWI